MWTTVDPMWTTVDIPIGGRLHGVDCDVEFGHFSSQCVGERDGGVFGGRVGRQARDGVAACGQVTGHRSGQVNSDGGHQDQVTRRSESTGQVRPGHSYSETHQG